MIDPLAQEVFALGTSFAYAFLVLGIAESLRRVLHRSMDFTRKFVHIGVGMWAVGTALLFDNKWFAIIPALAFIAINLYSYRKGVFQSMESTDRSNLGTVYFPIAFALMILLWFDHSKALFVACLMPLTWGDAFAAIVGKRWGKHRYTVFGTTRSIEGSVAMFAASAVTIWIPLAIFLFEELWFLAYDVANRNTTAIAVDVWSPFAPTEAYLIAAVLALIIALATTIVEARSPRGWDNLTVPFVAALICLAIYLIGVKSVVGP
jgi:dolichol kinase